MEIYFSINNREILLKGDINTFLVEYQYKSINNGVVYRIALNGLKIDKLHFYDFKTNKDDSSKTISPKDFLKDLYLQHKEFRFIIINEKLKLEDSNFIGIFESFQIVKDNMIIATIKRK